MCEPFLKKTQTNKQTNQKNSITNNQNVHTQETQQQQQQQEEGQVWLALVCSAFQKTRKQHTLTEIEKFHFIFAFSSCFLRACHSCNNSLLAEFSLCTHAHPASTIATVSVRVFERSIPLQTERPPHSHGGCTLQIEESKKPLAEILSTRKNLLH